MCRGSGGEVGEGKTRGREGKRKERGESEPDESLEEQEKRGRGKGLGVVKNERRKGKCKRGSLLLRNLHAFRM